MDSNNPLLCPPHQLIKKMKNVRATLLDCTKVPVLHPEEGKTDCFYKILLKCDMKSDGEKYIYSYLRDDHSDKIGWAIDFGEEDFKTNE